MEGFGVRFAVAVRGLFVDGSDDAGTWIRGALFSDVDTWQ
jgi:hypothetical protein